MSKTVVIHQPDFLSYLGFFHRLLHADQFVVLDHVQYVTGTSRSWMNRDKIKSSNGAVWLTVSVNKCPRDTPINHVKLSDKVPWRKNNLNLLKQHYAKSLFFSEVHPYVEMLYAAECDTLAEFNMRSIQMLCDLLDIEIDMVFSSDLDCHGRKNELLVNILTKVGASHYLSGLGAKDYFDSNPFDQCEIDVVWQAFSHPVYPQVHGGFIAGLSTIDMLYNCGIEKSNELLRSS
jgi:hypothetical protein